MDDDDKLIEHVRSIKPAAARKLASLPGETLHVDDPLIIEAAWGPRRVSRRTRGIPLQAYPEKVSAHRKLWERWLAQDQPYISVVIAKKKAQARIDAALAASGPAEDEPMYTVPQDEIDDLLAERAELRAEKRFAEADRIRDYLTRHGVEVQDGKVKT